MKSKLLSSKNARTTKFVVVVLAVVMVPGLIFSLLVSPLVGGVAGIAAMGAFLSALKSSLRSTIVFCVAMTVTSALVVLATPNPWLVAAIFLVSGLGVGVVAEHGLRATYGLVPMTAGFVLAGVEQVPVAPLRNALIVAGVIIVSAALAVLVVQSTMKTIPKGASEIVGHVRALSFGVVLGVMLAITAWIVTRYDLAHFGAWLILTLVVIMQPNIGDSWRKALQRAAGTVLGFFISIGIATTIDSSALLYVAAVIAVGLAATAMVDHKPYWMYATALTVAIVIFEGSSTSIVDTAKERLWATVIAALAALAVMAVLLPFEKRADTSRHAPEGTSAG